MIQHILYRPLMQLPSLPSSHASHAITGMSSAHCLTHSDQPLPYRVVVSPEPIYISKFQSYPCQSTIFKLFPVLPFPFFYRMV